jgi:hypothetical protein
MLSIEVLLGGVSRAKLELEEETTAGEAPRSKLERRSKIEWDMDY